MQKVLALALLCACFAAVPMKAQTPAVWYPTSNAPSGTCATNTSYGYLVVPAGTLYTCQNGTWAQISGGAGGNPCTSTAGAIQYNTSGSFGCANAVQNPDGSWVMSKAFDTNSATTYTWTSGTTTLDLSAGNFFIVTASGGNPVLAVNGDAHGSGPIWLQLINDTARTWTLPANFVNGCVPPNAGTAISTLQAYTTDGTNWYGQGCTSSETGTFRASEVSILTLTAPSSKGVMGFDSSAHLPCGIDNGSTTGACMVPLGVAGHTVNYSASGYPQDSGTAGGTGGTATLVSTAASATPTFTASSNTVTDFAYTFAQNVTSSTLAGASSGQVLNFNLCQPAAGGTYNYTFVPPANVIGMGTVQTGQSVCSNQPFFFNGTNALALGPMYTTGGSPTPGIVIPGSSSGSTVLQASAAASGTLTLPAATDTLVALATTQTLTNKTVDGVTPTVFGYVDPTSSIQTQLNAKQATLTGTGIARNTGASTELSGDCTTSGTNATTCKPGVLISTSGPVADPGGSSVFQLNNASGALTFDAPAGTGISALQRCYRNATGKSGAITIQMATSNTVDVNGANGSSAGTLVSTGQLGDEACIWSDATNHWYGQIIQGVWTNN